MLSLNSSEWMIDALCRNVGGVGKLWGFMHSKAYNFTAHHYLCAPFVSFLRCAKKSAQIVEVGFCDILMIFGVRRLAQIIDTIVKFVAVFVVNLAFWPSTMNKKPSKSMQPVVFAIKAHNAVAFLVDITRMGAGFYALSSKTLNPRKQSCFWVVVKKMAQAFCGKIGFSHDAPLMLIGQKPVRVYSTCGLRYFNIGKTIEQLKHEAGVA